MHRRVSGRARANARALRRDATDAELRLWYHLRRHGLDGHKFRRQHPVGPYIVDFYCAGAQLVVEVDGGQHFEAEQALRDEERTRYLEAQRLRVLRFTNLQVLQETDAVLEVILAALGAPLPNPLPGGARGSEGATP